MQIKVTMEPQKYDNMIKAVGSVVFGDEITVCDFTLRERKNGGLFLSVPNRETGKEDMNGRRKYKDIAFPITKECKTVLEEAAIESYEKESTVFLTDKKPARLLIEASVFETPYENRVGKAQIVISDIFVITNIFIHKHTDGSLYVTYPNFKTQYVGRDGKPIYREFIMMSTSLRKQINGVILQEYKKNLKLKEHDRFSIKSRLDEAVRVIKLKPDKKRTLNKDEHIL